MYYNTLMSWSIAYLVKSFSSPLPWTVDNENSLWNSKYFHEDLLERSNEIGEVGEVVPLMLLCQIAAYVLIFFTIFKGVKSSGKVVYVTALLPYVLLTFLFVKGLSLSGASSGLHYLFVPDWSKIATVKIWRDAISQIMYSSGVAFGPLMFYGACR